LRLGQTVPGTLDFDKADFSRRIVPYTACQLN
jgi:hypothetical protein